jgi:hypothetical protein
MRELNEIETRMEIEMEYYIKVNCILTLYGCLCTSFRAIKLLASRYPLPMNRAFR